MCVGTYGYRILRNLIFFRNAVKPSLDESFLLSTVLANDEVQPCSPTTGPFRAGAEMKKNNSRKNDIDKTRSASNFTPHLEALSRFSFFPSPESSWKKLFANVVM